LTSLQAGHGINTTCQRQWCF